MNVLANKKSWSYLPIILFASLAGTLPIIINPGLFWDDWVWTHQSKESAMQIGRELGIWWAGYLTNYINGLENPAITMRWVSLLSWIVGSASFAYVIFKEKLASARDCFLIFLLCIATQISPLRFIISLSMYNVYIASFWLGFAILKMNLKGVYKNTLSAILFLISFYLNSVLALYAFLITVNWLANQNLHFNVENYWRLFCDNFQWLMRNIPLGSTGNATKNKGDAENKAHLDNYFLKKIFQYVRIFFKDNIFWIFLPIIFILIKKISSTTSATYDGYNKINLGYLFQSIFDSFEQIFFAIKFLLSLGSIHPGVFFWVIFLICLFLLWLIPKSKQLIAEKLFSKLMFGMCLFVVSVIPYLAVNKPPVIGDPYESRHLMLAVFPLIFIVITALNILVTTVFGGEKNRLYAKNILVSYLLAVSIAGTFIAGLGLWRDFFTQKSFQSFIKDNKSEFSDISTFIISDETTDRFYKNREIWAYEFTGNLVNIYPNKDHLAVGLKEFNGWPKGTIFLKENFYKKRYNFDNYNFSNKQELITIENGENSYKSFKILSLVRSYFFDEEFQEKLKKFITIKSKNIFIDADGHVINLVRMKEALELFKKRNGQYPLSGRDSISSYVVRRINTGNSLEPAIGDIPKLFPRYMKKPKEMAEYKPQYPYYLYYSDGENYKLIYNNVNDIHYVGQAYPDLIDLNRLAAYGFWSKGASSW